MNALILVDVPLPVQQSCIWHSPHQVLPLGHVLYNYPMLWPILTSAS